MKTNKMKLALLATAVAGAMFSSAFANGTGTTATGTTNTGVTNTGVTHTGALPMVRHQMRDARHELRDLRHAGMAEVKALCADLKGENTQTGSYSTGTYSDYLRASLTVDEKTSIENLWKKYTDERKVIVSGTGTDTEKLAAVKVSLSGALASIKVYVATDKTAAYDVFVAAKLQALTLTVVSTDAQKKCQEARKAMKADIKEKAESIRKVLSVKLTTELNAKLDAIPAEKMEVVYNKLIDRIDMLIARAKSERVKVALQEVQAHVEARLALLATDE